MRKPRPRFTTKRQKIIEEATRKLESLKSGLLGVNSKAPPSDFEAEKLGPSKIHKTEASGEASTDGPKATSASDKPKISAEKARLERVDKLRVQLLAEKARKDAEPSSVLSSRFEPEASSSSAAVDAPTFEGLLTAEPLKKAAKESAKEIQKMAQAVKTLSKLPKTLAEFKEQPKTTEALEALNECTNEEGHVYRPKLRRSEAVLRRDLAKRWEFTTKK